MLRVSLSDAAITDEHLERAEWKLDCLEPFDFASHAGSISFPSGSAIERISPTGERLPSLTSPWGAFFHTVEFSPTAEFLLASSAGFDTVIEFHVQSGLERWSWNSWDHGYTFSSRTNTHIMRRREQAIGLIQGGTASRILLMEDPAVLPAEGVPTHFGPARLNGAAYDLDSRVLVTFYHGTGVFIIERSGRHAYYELGLQHPHSFTLAGPVVSNARYCVVDSGRGQCLWLDESVSPVAELRFDTLPAPASLKSGFGEWIQSASQVSDGLLIAIDALRSGLHVVDMPNRLRRFIPYPDCWSVQRAVELAHSG